MARVASISYQEAYIVNATPDEYALPSEMVDELAECCDLALRRARGNNDLPNSKLSALFALSEALQRYREAVDGERENRDVRFLIYEDANWSALRFVAVDCLVEFGIEANRLMAPEIDSIRA